MPHKWKKLLIAVGALLLAGTFWLVYWSALSGSDDIQCFANLQVIRAYVMRWITTHDGMTPPSLAALAGSENLPPRALLCPASDSKPKPGEFVCDYDSVFDRAGGPVAPREAESVSETILVWDKQPLHHRGGKKCRYVLFMGGQVKLLTESEFQQALQRLDLLFAPRHP